MNLIEGIQHECNRCRELIGIYEEIAPAGAIGVALIRASIQRAEAAIASGDVVAMVSAAKDLQEYKV